MRQRHTEVRIRDAHGKPMKWCPGCQEYKRTENFSPNAGRYDGLASYCRRHAALLNRRLRGASMDPDEKARLDYREMVTDRAALDELDRQDRRTELSHLGGLAGVREIRRRLAAVASLKAASHGLPLSDDQLDQAAEPIDCARSRRRTQDCDCTTKRPPGR